MFECVHGCDCVVVSTIPSFVTLCLCALVTGYVAVSAESGVGHVCG